MTRDIELSTAVDRSQETIAIKRLAHQTEDIQQSVEVVGVTKRLRTGKQ